MTYAKTVMLSVCLMSIILNYSQNGMYVDVLKINEINLLYHIRLEIYVNEIWNMLNGTCVNQVASSRDNKIDTKL